MPRESQDFSRRARLGEKMDEPCSREELRACLEDLARLNRWFLATRPVFAWLGQLDLAGRGRRVTLLDVGCGFGDTLRRIGKWAEARAIPMDLTGIDLNPDAEAIATEASGPASAIRWVACNVFAYEPPAPFDLIVSSLFTHHLDDQELIRFVDWMEARAGLGWCINDLYRAPLPYYLLRVFARVAGLHAFVQYDGPVSIARAFRPEDWRRICAEAGLKERDVIIRPYTPARLCVMRRKA